MSWSERALSISLALLPIIIILGSVYFSLQENNFDWQRALIDSDQVQNVAEKLQPSQLSGDIIEMV